MFASFNEQGNKECHETLYEACRDIVGVPNGLAMALQSLRSHTRLVAFWCSWENKIKVGFQASEYERQLIKEWF